MTPTLLRASPKASSPTLSSRIPSSPSNQNGWPTASAWQRAIDPDELIAILQELSTEPARQPACRDPNADRRPGNPEADRRLTLLAGSIQSGAGKLEAWFNATMNRVSARFTTYASALDDSVFPRSRLRNRTQYRNAPQRSLYQRSLPRSRHRFRAAHDGNCR